MNKRKKIWILVGALGALAAAGGAIYATWDARQRKLAQSRRQSQRPARPAREPAQKVMVHVVDTTGS